MSSQEGTRAVTIEIVVGVLVTIILVLFFLDISIVYKIVLVLFLGAVAIANFLALTRQTEKLKSRLASRRQERLIRKRPDLILELYRLNQQLRKVAYDRSGRPSLAVVGNVVTVAVENEIHDNQKLSVEFGDKTAMADFQSSQVQQRISDYVNGSRKWEDTRDFALILRETSANLNLLSFAIRTVYRQVNLWPKSKPFPSELKTHWESFKDDYNVFLHDWKAFTDKCDQIVGYGTGFGIEIVKTIPTDSY